MIDRYVIVLEDAGTNFCAYIPDLPGCITTGPTIEQTVANIREAMAFHLESMRRDGDDIPPPTFRLGDPLEFADSAIGVVEVTSAPLVPA
jgi:predicted RNase H-like HicB family nuclease